MELRLAEKIELRDLAAVAGLSECHFSRAFKQSVSAPPHRHVVRRRIAAATELIKTTEQAMTQISPEVGFSDQSHFTRVFFNRRARLRAPFGVSIGCRANSAGTSLGLQNAQPFICEAMSWLT